jgi:hypothetical protein
VICGGEPKYADLESTRRETSLSATLTTKKSQIDYTETESGLPKREAGDLVIVTNCLTDMLAE